MNGQQREQLTAFIARRVIAGASAPQLAEAIEFACLGIEAALLPIVGQRGVAALFTRSMHLCARVHPWLAAAPHGTEATIDAAMTSPVTAATLRELLSPCAVEDAAAIGSLFLTTFDDLLTSLVGASLTARLLDPVWTTLSSGPPAEDISA